MSNVIFFILFACTQATQVAHVAKEWVDQAFYEKKEEDSKRCAA